MLNHITLLVHLLSVGLDFLFYYLYHNGNQHLRILTNPFKGMIVNMQNIQNMQVVYGHEKLVA